VNSWTTVALALLCALVVLSIPVALLTAHR